MSMEFMLRLFDSFLRERIPCEKQKNKRHHISIGWRYCLPLQGGCSYHIRWVVWIGWDYWPV